jgi:precorrin-2 dehydrogenase / sirohydrochlorin ferrochelatase
MALFPAFLKLAGRPCLVVGAGRVAEDKIESLLLADADVRVVAPKATARIRALARAKEIGWETRPFRPSDLDRAFLVVAATSSSALHAKIFADARRRGTLCNVVDDPEHCDFYYGAIVRRGALQIAISTEGHSPALAQRLKKKIASEFGTEYENWLAELGSRREQLFAEKKLTPARRKALLHQLASEASFRKFRRRKKGGERRARKSH